jgi:uncharacterized metal-binding protein
MAVEITKVGIVSCSGEEVPGGTCSRLACRKVLGELRPAETVTICLPLFIAGGKEEREFAARYPTITVDGCQKRCAQLATERLSGKPSRSLSVAEILERRGLASPKDRRRLSSPADAAAVEAVAEEVARTVDEVLEED